MATENFSEEMAILNEISIKKGLDLPITGGLTNSDVNSKSSSTIAIVGADFIGMKPSLKVKVGDQVKAGQVLFTCKKNEGLSFCSRYNGKVEEINRGEKRVFESLVISVSGDGGNPGFKSYKNSSPSSVSREEACELLIESGEWMALRQRPFDKVATVGGEAESLFVTAMDTNPLSFNPKIAIDRWKDEFKAGLEVLSKLPTKQTFVCAAEDLGVEMPNSCKVVRFSGPHPAGNVGTHIHFLQPINQERKCWHVGYQDVIAIGHLFSTGKLMTERLVSLAGPMVQQPKILEVSRGAKVSEIVSGEIAQGEARVIAGSVFNGRHAEASFDYLGQYHNQVTVIKEDDNREFLGWQSPGFDKFSTKPIFLSRLMPGKKFAFGSSTHGSLRAMVPIGMFENVMPMDILPTQLLRALASKDVEGAQDLGCLELGEEDLALCTFVAPGKVDFGPLLRQSLDTIEREG